MHSLQKRTGRGGGCRRELFPTKCLASRRQRWKKGSLSPTIFPLNYSCFRSPFGMQPAKIERFFDESNRPTKILSDRTRTATTVFDHFWSSRHQRKPRRTKARYTVGKKKKEKKVKKKARSPTPRAAGVSTNGISSERARGQILIAAQRRRRWRRAKKRGMTYERASEREREKSNTVSAAYVCSLKQTFDQREPRVPIVANHTRPRPVFSSVRRFYAIRQHVHTE